MKLQKAIEITAIILRPGLRQLAPDDIDAIRLTREAAILYQHNRHIGQHVDPIILPGETEE